MCLLYIVILYRPVPIVSKIFANSRSLLCRRMFVFKGGNKRILGHNAEYLRDALTVSALVPVEYVH